MISPFGVDHGVGSESLISKSFIPAHIGPRGGSWIKSTALTTQERKAMKTNFSRKARVRGVLGNKKPHMYVKGTKS